MPSTIILSDNGATSGSAGLKTSGGNDGVLLLQTTTSGGTPTTAISISNTQVVTYTNQPTYTGGTANGVLYLNGSKAVTSGTALVFDGTNLGVGVTPSAIAANYATLQLGGSVGGGIKLGTSSASVGYVAGSAGGVEIGTTGSTSLSFFTNNATRATLDTSGNLGLGVTPSAWASGSKAINVGAWGTVSSNTTSGNLELTNNAYQSSNAGVFTYVNTQAATRYAQALGSHYWYSAGSGTSGNAISFNQVMYLSTGGMLTASAGYTNLFTPILSSYQTTSPAAANILLVGSNNDRDCWIYRDPAGGADNWGIYHRNIDSTVANLPGNSIGFIGANSLAAYIDLENKRIRSMTAVDQPYMMVVRTNGYTVADGFTDIQYDVLVYSRYMSHTSGVNMYFDQPGKYLIITGWRFGSGGDVWTGVRLRDNDGTIRGLGFATGQITNDPGPCTIQFIADIPAARTGQAMAMQFIRAGSTMGIATPASGSYGYAIVTTVIQIGV